MAIHVAVMLVGLNRSLDHTAPSIVSHLLEPLQSSRIFDLSCRIILIHPKDGVRNPRTNEVGAVTAEVPPSLQSYPVITLDQDTLADHSRELADELCERGDTWGDGAQSVRNAVIFLTALREAWNQVPPEADVVIFARPDISIEQSPHVRYHSAVVWALSRLGLPAIRIPSWGGWRSKKGINDRFAIASRVAAERYFRRVEQLPNLLPEG